MDHNKEEFLENMQHFHQKYMELLDMMMKKKFDNYNSINLDIDSLRDLYINSVTDFTKNPQKFMMHNLEYVNKLSKLMFNYMEKFQSNNGEFNEFTEDDLLNKRDRRFKDPAWKDSFYYSFIKQFYLISSNWYRNLIDQLEIEEDKKNILNFYSEQLLNAACPSNFPMLNPEVIKEVVDSKGKNLIKGIENFIEDLKSSDSIFRISTTDKNYFEIGKNIAASPGKVIMRNDLAELICYEPKGNSPKIPIFVVPPWINKYYVLDLSPDNSFIKFLTDKGFQVFLVSWNNPDANFAHKNFEDYLKEGVIEPLKYLEDNFNLKKIHLLGYCLGGTLASCAMSYFQKIGKKDFITSGTFLTTMLDFAKPGELGFFINEQTIKHIFDEINKKGYFDGKLMSNAFSLLRSNDLIWSFVVNNYLLGKKPIAYDLLYWNSDNTNLPAAMHSFYLENMYIKNALTIPNKIELLGIPIDLSQIDSKLFFLSTKDDHIAPWQSTYMGVSLFKKAIDNAKFCLAGSGHIAGVINPPHLKKYNFWMNNKISETPDLWFQNAKEQKGSWWDYWDSWIKEIDIPKIEINYDKIPYIDFAPGNYVKISYDNK